MSEVQNATAVIAHDLWSAGHVTQQLRRLQTAEAVSTLTSRESPNASRMCWTGFVRFSGSRSWSRPAARGIKHVDLARIVESVLSYMPLWRKRRSAAAAIIERGVSAEADPELLFEPQQPH